MLGCGLLGDLTYYVDIPHMCMHHISSLTEQASDQIYPPTSKNSNSHLFSLPPLPIHLSQRAIAS